MRPLHFYKYDAAGNDFVLIDNRQGGYAPTSEEIARICHRRQGVGADGLILIEADSAADFRMVYYNADGSQSLCGNGCRAAVHLAAHLSMIGAETVFSAYDGLHNAALLGNGQVRLQMNDVSECKPYSDGFLLQTGSPHWVGFVTDLDRYDVVGKGKSIRYHPDLAPGGVNVNFVELLPRNELAMRTYERGVEDETWACGTGAVAVALAASQRGYTSPILIHTRGGDLLVAFEGSTTSGFSKIFLTGPAHMAFEGELIIAL